MTITQQQAREALERVYYATHASFIDRNLVRQYIEQSTAQPQAVVPARPQEFESAQGRALAVAWAEGWAQCRDAEYVGEDAQDEAFNQSVTLAQCLHADQTRFQGGLSNDQLRRAWSAKLPNVIPTDEQLTAFALGIEAAAQPSAQAERAPVVQAVPASEKDKAIYKEIADNYRGGVQAVQAGECGFTGMHSNGKTYVVDSDGTNITPQLAAFRDRIVASLQAEDAPSEAELLNAIKSGKAVLVDWPMEPSTPEEALELMDMMDAEYAKTMGKPAPDAEMGNSMRRVRHMACDLWAWQKDTMREAFNEAVRAERKA